MYLKHQFLVVPTITVTLIRSVNVVVMQSVYIKPAHKFPVYQFQVTNSGLPVSSHEFRFTSFKWRIPVYQFQVMNSGLPVSSREFRFTSFNSRSRQIICTLNDGTGKLEIAVWNWLTRNLASFILFLVIVFKLFLNLSNSILFLLHLTVCYLRTSLGRIS